MISVIIPYDKDRGYLKQCIESVENQTYKDFEIVLSQGFDPVAVNFNNGLKKAKGEFCKFVTEDDWLPENSLQDLINGIEDYTWVFANSFQVEADGTWIYKPPKEALQFASNVQGNKIHGGTTLYRTEVLREIGGMKEHLWTGEEYEMHLNLFSKGFLPGYINKVVYYHRLWSGQKSKQYRKKRKHERENELKKIRSLYIDQI
jgi:glycosyltransferase involved in cell wall biosynthesis